MLEVAAGGAKQTTGAVIQQTDFHVYYKSTPLCLANTETINSLCSFADDDAAVSIHSGSSNEHKSLYAAPNGTQMKLLIKRAVVAYWRTPSYNFTRVVLNVVVALLFASVFADQTYDSDITVISRSAVIFIGVLFCGILGMNTVIPVMMSNREAYYREQQEIMYNPLFYEIALGLVEVPYLAVSTLAFTVPFFFIIGLDGHSSGDTTAKFFWFWLFIFLFVSVCVHFGQFLGMATKDAAAATVAAGFFSNLNSTFSGFMIKSQVFLCLSFINYSLKQLMRVLFFRISRAFGFSCII